MRWRALEGWGWTRHEARAWLQAVEEGELLHPARVVAGTREVYRVRTAAGEQRARPAGRLREKGQLPAVGDWVAVRMSAAAADAGEALIERVLPRRSRLSRKVAGERTQEQVVAANVDVVFLLMGLDGDFNLRRIERFLTLAHASAVEAVVVLTKSDLLSSEEAMQRRLEVQDCAPGVAVLCTSSLQGTGFEPLRYYLNAGRTVALMGSSGVGKSTLLNHLVGSELLRTAEVRSSDDRGRHTTTHRELIRLPSEAGGALLIDNPGIRELQLWSDDDRGIADAFADLAELAVHCRYRDCAHEQEPGCAVVAAVREGTLDSGRLENHHALLREQRFLELRRNDAERRKMERAQGAMYKAVMSEKSRRRH